MIMINRKSKLDLDVTKTVLKKKISEALKILITYLWLPIQY